jgi:hypothetical protein
MAILIYWKYEKFVNSIGKGFPWAFNSKQARLHTATEIGEDVFVVSGVRKASGLEIYLLAHLIVSDKTHSPNHKYGRFRILADRSKSKYFSIDKEALTPVLLMLTSIKQFGERHIDKYAQSFQTLRKLDGHDTYMLKRFAKSLSLHSSQSNQPASGGKKNEQKTPSHR